MTALQRLPNAGTSILCPRLSTPWWADEECVQIGEEDFSLGKYPDLAFDSAGDCCNRSPTAEGFGTIGCPQSTP
jgi:hypothetical protein